MHGPDGKSNVIPSHSMPFIDLRGAIAVLLCGLFAALVAAPAVWAHDHRVPRANLHVNEQAKRLGAWTSTWVRPDGPGFCVIEHSDGGPGSRP